MSTHGATRRRWNPSPTATMEDAAAPNYHHRHISSPPKPQLVDVLFFVTNMEKNGRDVGDGARNSPTAASGSSVVDAAPSFSSGKGVVFLQRGFHIMSMGGRRGGFPSPSSSSSLGQHVLPAPPPIFAGSSPWSMRPAELRDPHGLSHQLGAMAMDTAPLFPFPTGFVSHKTMATENHLPGPSDAHGMVSLVNTVLWNPGALREHADGAARSAALCEVSSRHWQALLAAGDGDCVARTVDVVLWFIFELMAHEIGHHLFKRLVRACGEAQLGRVVGAVAASPWELVASAMQLDGRRSVEKLLVAVRQQGRMLQRLTEALSVGVAELMMDSCGHTLVETCLNRLNPEQNRFIFTAAMANLKKLAKTKHGSPSVIKCIEHAPSPAREVLVNAVISASACLSQDPRGNYVVQRVIELEDEEYTGRLCRGLSSHWVQLAMHKNGSHVLECGVRSPAARRRIAEALMSSGKLDQIARDPYGNYVVQRMLEALKISEPELHEELVRSLQPHLQSLRYHPHGGKVLELLIQLKSPTPP